MLLTIICLIAVASGIEALSEDELKSIMPRVPATKASSFAALLTTEMNGGAIETCCRQAAFLAQVAYESSDLNWFQEMGSGKGYEGRKDLGNNNQGDGVKYKGRGPLQIVGRSTYRSASRVLGTNIEQTPKLVEDPNLGFKVAVWYWNSLSLSTMSDCSQGNFEKITKKLSPNMTGKEGRASKFATAKAVLKC